MPEFPYNSDKDRRYQVFVSSTFRDLRDERKAAVEGIYERGHIPIALEGFSPKNESDLNVIKSAMKNCQVYLLILGHRYGDMVKGKGLSYTEFEYELALEYNLKVLVFLMNPDEIEKRRKKLDPKNERDRKEIGNDELLDAFHKRCAQHFRRIWTSEDPFKQFVELALADNLKDWDRRGFVMEPEDSSILETAQNEFIVDIVNELKGLEKLYLRCSHEPEKKRELGKFFSQKYLDKIIDQDVSMFFESGSTVAFVCKDMAKKLKHKVKIKRDGSPNINISTNNVLVYLLLWLTTRTPCTQFPWSPPVDNTYGAAYGGMEESLHSQNPDYLLAPTSEGIKREINKLLKTPFTLTAMPKPAILFGAASGLKLSENVPLRFKDNLSQSRKDELKKRIQKCYGPFVSSYHNKVFKRFMYATNIPIAIFMTDEKIDSEILVGEEHFILDSELNWENFYKNHPVAFCIGCEDANKTKYKNMFEDLGFKITCQNAYTHITAFIARNSAFISQFENI